MKISQSGIWKQQRDYYQTMGVAAWDERIPYYVTNSQVIAETYADLVVAQLLDSPIDVSEPLYLVELGSGTGRFGYQLAREVRRKLAFFPSLRAVRPVVVLTDIVLANVEFWEKHPRLQQLRERVDFAEFAPEQESSLFLRRAQSEFREARNPFFVIANYVFDSLPHDEYRCREGALEERHWEGGFLPAEADTPLLRHYRDTIPWGSFTVPVGALQCLENLRSLGQRILLSSDKGFTNPQVMAAQPEHPLARHEGCFSHMVNYHALSFGFRSGLASNRHSLDGVQTVCLSDLKQGPHLRYAFQERLVRRDAINSGADQFAVWRDKQNLRAILGFLRINLEDPNAFSVVARKLADQVGLLSAPERAELVAMLEHVWENDYYFQGSPNVTFWMGHLYGLLGLFERAHWFFQKTVERHGPDEMLYYLQGSCLQALGKRDVAREMYRKALEIKPDMREALEALGSA